MASPASSPALRQFLIHMFKLVQMEQQRSSELEKNNTKLKSTMTEMHTKHVSPLNLAAQNALFVSPFQWWNHAKLRNSLPSLVSVLFFQVAGMKILQAKISALEKELDAEKVSAASLQSRYIQYLFFSSLMNSLSRLNFQVQLHHIEGISSTKPLSETINQLRHCQATA